MEDEPRIRETHHLRLIDPTSGAEAEAPVDEVDCAGEPTAAVADGPVLWAGRPSLLVAVVPCALAVLILLIALVVTHGWAPWGWGAIGDAKGLAGWISDGRLWMALTLGWCTRVVLDVVSESYLLTSRHLRVSKGFFVSRTVERDVRPLETVTLVEPWFLRRAGRAHVGLNFPAMGCRHCGGPQQWMWTVRGVADAAGLRRLLHELREGRG